MSGGLPDVLTVDGPNVSAYAANGIIQPLAEISEEERSVYLESIIDQGTYDGKLYALGVLESSVGMYYNKDILEEAGIEVAQQISSSYVPKLFLQNRKVRCEQQQPS